MCISIKLKRFWAFQEVVQLLEVIVLAQDLLNDMDPAQTAVKKHCSGSEFCNQKRDERYKSKSVKRIQTLLKCNRKVSENKKTS